LEYGDWSVGCSFIQPPPLHHATIPSRALSLIWHNACMARCAPQPHGRLQCRLVARYFMTRILYLPTPAQGRSEAATQESEAQEIVSYCSQTERIAHDLRNCMSVLLLTITSLKDNQALISESHKRVLENVVEEMNRLVDEMVRLAGRQVNKV